MTCSGILISESGSGESKPRHYLHSREQTLSKWKDCGSYHLPELLGKRASSLECLGGASGKEPACQCWRCWKQGFDPWVGKTPWSRHGNPLQCSCLENPMDRGARWATVHGVAKSWTRLKRLSMHACVYKLYNVYKYIISKHIVNIIIAYSGGWLMVCAQSLDTLISLEGYQMNLSP